MKPHTTLNINRFSVRQTWNDNRGKSSASLFYGSWVIVIGCGGFIASIWMKFNDGITGSYLLVMVGAGMIVGKTFSKDKPISEEVSKE